MGATCSRVPLDLEPQQYHVPALADTLLGDPPKRSRRVVFVGPGTVTFLVGNSSFPLDLSLSNPS